MQWPAIKRVPAIIGGMLLSGWTLLLAGLDWFGRSTSVRDALTMAGVPDFLFLPPWWIPGLCCLATTAFVIWLGWPTPAVVKGAPLNKVERPPAPVTGPIPATASPRRIMSDVIVVAGTAEAPPSFTGRFSENGRDLAFYIEFSSFIGGIGFSGWSAPRKVLARHQQRYARDEQVSFPLIRMSDLGAGASWQFAGVNADKYQDLIREGDACRGRVTALNSDNVEQHCYFLILGSNLGVPNVIGEHMFDHIYTWEGEPSPSGDVQTLFQ